MLVNIMVYKRFSFQLSVFSCQLMAEAADN